MNSRFLTAALLSVFMTGGILPSPLAHSQAPKKAAKTRTVYVCKACKMYYAPSVAKKMSYKDPMGHKLVKMSSRPSGYKMGSMDKMKDEDKNTTKDKAEDKDTASTKQASTMKCPVCKTMDMTSTQTASNTQEVKIKGKTWYCCAGCDMSSIADKQ